MYSMATSQRARKNRNKANKNVVSFRSQRRMRINQTSFGIRIFGRKRPTSDKDCD